MRPVLMLIASLACAVPALAQDTAAPPAAPPEQIQAAPTPEQPAAQPPTEPPAPEQAQAAPAPEQPAAPPTEQQSAAPPPAPDQTQAAPAPQPAAPPAEQQATGQVTDHKKPALAEDPAVRKSQEPEPGPQGIRSPKPETSAATKAPDLQEALAQFRQAPPNLEGQPMPRPNELASEPNQPDGQRMQ